MEVPPDLSKSNFIFLFFNTLLMGIMVSVPAVIQPAFLSDVIRIDQRFAGSINGLLQTMSQLATLVLVAFVGVFSDEAGRKIPAFSGFLKDRLPRCSRNRRVASHRHYKLFRTTFFCAARTAFSSSLSLVSSVCGGQPGM